MFNNEYIDHLKEEIAYLRELVKKQSDEILVLSGKSADLVNVGVQKVDPIAHVDELTGNLIKFEEMSEQDKKDYEAAQEEISEIEITANMGILI